MERQLQVGEVAPPGSVSASSLRSGSIACRWVPERTSRTARPNTVSLNTTPRDSPHHRSASRSGRAVRVGGDEGAVDRADGRADDEVGPDPGLGQRAQHADLVRAEQPAAAEYECSRHLSQGNPRAGTAAHTGGGLAGAGQVTVRSRNSLFSLTVTGMGGKISTRCCASSRSAAKLSLPPLK